MDYYLLPILFKKLFHLSCLEIWLSRANDIIVKLLKWPRARQGARKVLVGIVTHARTNKSSSSKIRRVRPNGAFSDPSTHANET